MRVRERRRRRAHPERWQSKGSHRRTERSARSGGMVELKRTSWRITSTVACCASAAALAAQLVRKASARFIPSSAHIVRSQ